MKPTRSQKTTKTPKVRSMKGAKAAQALNAATLSAEQTAQLAQTVSSLLDDFAAVQRGSDVSGSDVSGSDVTTADADATSSENNSEDTAESACTDMPAPVDSLTDTTSVSTMTSDATDNSSTLRRTIMEVTLTRDTKARKSTSVVYLGGTSFRGGVRIPKSAFIDKNAPETLTLSSDAFATPRARETKEERKARLAARPKLTLAEKIAKREAALARMKAKAAAVVTA